MSEMSDDDEAEVPEDLGINPEKVCYIIVASRELDAVIEDDEEEETAPHGAEVADDIDESAEEYGHDATYQELRSFISGLNEEEQTHLVALMWVGRGEYGRDEWDEALAEAERAPHQSTADYLIDTPLLADYLEEGLDQFDVSCEDFDPGRL